MTDWKTSPNGDLDVSILQVEAIRQEKLILQSTKRQVRKLVSIAKYPADHFSEKEKRRSLTLRTLDKNIAAIGGKLRFVVELPDRPSVKLSLNGRIVSAPK